MLRLITHSNLRVNVSLIDRMYHTIEAERENKVIASPVDSYYNDARLPGSSHAPTLTRLPA